MCIGGMSTSESFQMAGVFAHGGEHGVKAMAAKKEQEAANRANEYNARVMERNAAAAMQQAAYAEKVGKIEANQRREAAEALKGKQRSTLAGSGVVIDQGSALDTIMDTTTLSEMDALTIERNAAMEAWGYKNNEANYSAQARLSRMGNRNPQQAAGMTFLTSTVAGATSAASFAMK